MKSIQEEITRTEKNLFDAETCLRECSEDGPEYAVLQRLIKTLQMALNLLRAITDLIGDKK